MTKREQDPRWWKQWLRRHNRIIQKYGVIGNPKAEKLISKIQDILEKYLDEHETN